MRPKVSAIALAGELEEVHRLAILQLGGAVVDHAAGVLGGSIALVGL